MLFIFSSSGASGAWLQRIGGEEPRQAGASHNPRHDRLAGSHTGQDLPASLCAAASCRGPQHPAPPASPGHPLLVLHRLREGRGQQCESQRACHQISKMLCNHTVFPFLDQVWHLVILHLCSDTIDLFCYISVITWLNYFRTCVELWVSTSSGMWVYPLSSI